MKRPDKIGNIILDKYYEVQKQSAIGRKVTSVSLGIEDYYQFRAELPSSQYYIEFHRYQVKCLYNKRATLVWNDFKINCCPRKKRLIRVNFKLEPWQLEARRRSRAHNKIQKMVNDAMGISDDMIIIDSIDSLGNWGNLKC